jgi:hypothetical protein
VLLLAIVVPIVRFAIGLMKGLVPLCMTDDATGTGTVVAVLDSREDVDGGGWLRER